MRAVYVASIEADNPLGAHATFAPGACLPALVDAVMETVGAAPGRNRYGHSNRAGRWSWPG
jgi:hypothetical protein